MHADGCVPAARMLMGQNYISDAGKERLHAVMLRAGMEPAF